MLMGDYTGSLFRMKGAYLEMKYGNLDRPSPSLKKVPRYFAPSRLHINRNPHHEPSLEVLQRGNLETSK